MADLLAIYFIIGLAFGYRHLSMYPLDSNTAKKKVMFWVIDAANYFKKNPFKTTPKK